MAQTLAAVRERLAGIKAKPGLGLTTVGLGQQIEAAGQRAGTRAGTALAAGAVAVGALLGVALWYVLPAVLPGEAGNWLAASLIGGSPRQAGQALMRGAATRPGFNRLVQLSQACGGAPVARCIAGISRETAMSAGHWPNPATVCPAPRR